MLTFISPVVSFDGQLTPHTAPFFLWHCTVSDDSVAVAAAQRDRVLFGRGQEVGQEF